MNRIFVSPFRSLFGGGSSRHSSTRRWRLCGADSPGGIIPTWLPHERRGSIVDRLIGGGPEVGHHLWSYRRVHQPLGQQDPGELFPGVGIPGRAVAALPAETAGVGVKVIAPGEDRNAKAPAAIEIGRASCRER